MKKIFLFILLIVVAIPGWSEEYYLVGGATQSGWNSGEYDRVGVRAYTLDSTTWVWTGKLTTGEGDAGRFKIPSSVGGWDGFWAPTQGTVLTSEWSDLSTDNSGDNKFCVAQEGFYLVTFNTSTKKIKAEYLGELTKEGDYYLISSVEDYYKFVGYIGSDATKTAKARLTADLDFAGKVFYPMGSDKFKFKGEFDGAGHTISNAIVNTHLNYIGLFTYIADGAYIHDLIINDNCSFTGGAKVGGIAGFARDGGTVTLKNLVNAADVKADGTKDANAAGFVGCYTDGTTAKVTNCVNAGDIIGFSDGQNQAGAFTGWSQAGSTYTNCLNIGEIANDGGLLRGTATQTNCHNVAASDPTVKSGELCYKMNGDQSDVNWFQNLGEGGDSIPVPFNTHRQVFANGNLRCDGTSAGGELTYSNSNTSEIPPHTNENGWCSVCGTFDKNYLTANGEGYFEIRTANDLKWFAEFVAGVNQSANAKLTEDIDYTAYKQGFIGANESKAFNGTFDGQGHTITIDIVNDGTTGRTGLFAYINAATIKNLVVEGSATSADRNCVGGLGGRSDGDGTLIENVIVKTAVSYTGSNVDATCGGFFANMEAQATLKNCAFLGSINSDSAEGNGGLVGWAGSSGNNKYINCLVAPVSYTQNGNSGDYARNNPSVTNCFKVSADDARLASGELCYKLNAGGENWFQNLGDGGDSHPVPFSSHLAVYKTSDAGWSTLYDAENALRFNGAKAYTGKVVGQWLTLTEVEEIPAATAVLLEGTYYNKVVLDGAAEVEGNDLVGAAEDVEADGTQYVFAQKNNKLGFYKAEAGTTIKAGKGYISAVSSSVKGFIIDLDGTTAIQGVEAEATVPTVVYDLSGRRVKKVQKGIYIVNGKKIAVK